MPYLFEGRKFGRVLDVSEAGVLSCQLVCDASVLGVLGREDQARVVTQLPQVLQGLERGRSQPK